MDTLCQKTPFENGINEPFLSALFERNLQPVAILDNTLQMVSANRSFCGSIGMASPQPINHFNAQELPFYYNVEFKDYLLQLPYGKHETLEIQLMVENEGGNLQYLLLKIAPSFALNTIHGAIMTLSPFGLEQSEKHLQLENLARIAAHDLREPLRTIGNFTQLLLKRYDGQLDGIGQVYLRYITQGVKRMDSMLTDILVYSRHESEPNSCSSVLPLEAINAAKKDIKALLSQKEGEVEIGPLPAGPIWATTGKVRALFTHLIENALKFSKEGQKPVVKISGGEDGEYWRFSVSDNGIGIAPEFQEKVFQLFKRLNRREEFSGNGIGLSICRKIVVQHGGQIWISSEPGKGSTFHFTIKKPQL